ncbi:hypothetical protein GGF41_006769 [Coemansia sp. RSA 2531]|nr:hypothetical protein GGF41_006769 [Coemansia sp. RSA 2531]
MAMLAASMMTLTCTIEFPIRGDIVALAMPTLNVDADSASPKSLTGGRLVAVSCGDVA